MEKEAKKILLIEIVEDEEPILKILSEKFSREGFETVEAEDGEDGLKKALEHKPDLILLDLLMPRMDGITMLNKLREDAWGKEVPVVVLTNLNDKEKIAAATENKAFDYLIKADWKLDDIVRKVKQRLGLK